MNWFLKYIFSSNNIIFPKNIEEQINYFSNFCVDYYFNNEIKAVVPDRFDFINTYTDKQDFIPVIVFPYNDNMENVIAVFNPQYRNISIFPYHHNLKNVNKENLFKYLKENIYHELTHAIDPKFQIPNWWKDRNKINYLLREEEFDAYSKQIEIMVKQNLNKTNLKEFKNWLVSFDSPIPSYLISFKKVIDFWINNNKKYIKKLKKRLYNVFSGDIKDV